MGTEKTLLAQTLEKLDEKCRGCRPLTPMECVEGCDVWRFKNELKRLYGVISQEGFQNKLLNALKNKSRLEVLGMLTTSRFSVSSLQKELREHGYVHSQKTIVNEYIQPLAVTGLILSNSGCYRATMFGSEIYRLFSGFHDIGEVLSPHSRCYEEEILQVLFEKPRTFEELKSRIQIKSLPRALERLQRANLIAKQDENNYIFYFKTKRDPNIEKLSLTEKRVHENIPEEGITAEKLAEKTKISLRRTYKYLRKLRGKKLAFKRRCPKTYFLSTEGMRIAETLKKMRALVMDFAQVSAEIAKSLGVLERVSAPDVGGNVGEKPLQVLVKSDVPHKIY